MLADGFIQPIKTSTLDYNGERWLSSIINCVILRLWVIYLYWFVCVELVSYLSYRVTVEYSISYICYYIWCQSFLVAYIMLVQLCPGCPGKDRHSTCSFRHVARASHSIQPTKTPNNNIFEATTTRKQKLLLCEPLFNLLHNIYTYKYELFVCYTYYCFLLLLKIMLHDVCKRRKGYNHIQYMLFWLTHSK